MSKERNGHTFSLDVCENCAQSCCRDANPPLTTDRRRILTEHLVKQGQLTSGLFVGKEYCHPLADEAGFCRFYCKQTRQCSVHVVKPETCRAGPITFDVNFRTRKVEFFLKNSEICAFAGLIWANKKALQRHLEAAVEEINRLILQLDREALIAILHIPEPQTFKIHENDLPPEVAEKLGIA